MKGTSSNNIQTTIASCMRPFTVTLPLIAQLQQPYRTAVHLHYIDKQSYAKIAQRLKLPVGTVKSHISRGMKLLQESMLADVSPPWRNDDVDQSSTTWTISELRVNALPEPYRTVVHLHCVEQLSYAIIAEQLQLPEGTVKSQFSRGMKRLHAMCSQNTTTSA